MKKKLQISNYKDLRCVIEASKNTKSKNTKSKKHTHRHGYIPKRSKGSQTYGGYKRQLSKAEKRLVNI